MTRALLTAALTVLLSACNDPEQRKQAAQEVVSMCAGNISIELRLGAYGLGDELIVKCDNFKPAMKGTP